MTISFDARGDFKNTERFLSKVSKLDIMPALRALAQAGVRALSSRTPIESGGTAAAWGYEISVSKGSSTITWTNSHTVNGVNIAIILQAGHGTGTGGWVAGRDYINPAIRPIMDQIAEDAWKVVTTA
ncbi:hypothetical protein SEA_DAMASCUS_23 [Microbacterium phage Damascus]|nr:hypothetical protein SEA_DAMASCUS_23 [Microbacterium phage Damascus]